MPITFAVDDKEEVLTRLPTTTINVAAQRMLAVELLAASHDTDLVDDEARGVFGGNIHSILACVHKAFAEHRPLALSPDHVWLAIAQGFARHIDHNAEAMRHHFVAHAGKVNLEVQVQQQPSDATAWNHAVDSFIDRITARVGPGIVRLLECDFSTTTPAEAVAGRIVTMAAFKKYFDYRLLCICGIPWVTLEGTVQDWREIRARIDVLAEYDLNWWAEVLRPVCDEFVKTASGKPDPEFWRAIYKPQQAYGEEVVTGWVMRLFPYLENGKRSPACVARPTTEANTSSNTWVGPALACTAAPSGLSVAPLTIETEAQKSNVQLTAGFVGYNQLENGALRPAIAWCVSPPTRATAAIYRLLTDVRCRVKTPEKCDEERLKMEIPAALVELFEHCDGFHFDGVPGLGVRTRVGLAPVAERGDDFGTVFADLDDGRRVAVMLGDNAAPVLLAPRAGEPLQAEEIPVIADDIVEWFEQLVRAPNPSAFTKKRSLYDALPHDARALRRVLRTPGAVRSDLTQREARRLAIGLRYMGGEAALLDFWWACLVATLALPHPHPHYFDRQGGYDEIQEAISEKFRAAQI